MSTQPKDRATLQRAIEMYASGAPIKDICKETGCCPTTVRWYARIAGYTRPKNWANRNSCLSQEQVKELLDMYRRGYNTKFIAKRFGITTNVVYKHVSRNKMCRNKKHENNN